MPCARNFLLLRQNYLNFLKSEKAISLGIYYKPNTFTVLMPPITPKMLNRILDVNLNDKNNRNAKL